MISEGKFDIQEKIKSTEMNTWINLRQQLVLETIITCGDLLLPIFYRGGKGVTDRLSSFLDII